MALGGAFLFVAKSVAPVLSFHQRFTSSRNGDALSDLNKTETDKEITFSDKMGNKVLVVEK